MDVKKMNLVLLKCEKLVVFWGFGVRSYVRKDESGAYFRRNSLTSSAASRRLICRAFCSVLVLATSLDFLLLQNGPTWFGSPSGMTRRA